jgi:hypothetical protein
MPLINFYTQIKQKKKHNPNYETHKIDLNFRMLINCASGGGKSNLLTNILYLFNNTFSKIIIVSKEPEPLYEYVITKIPSIQIYYEGIIPDIEKLEDNKNGLIVFDDMILTPDNRIGEMFIRGRKLGYSCIFISQSFFSTPKIIRQNCNYFLFGPGMSRRDLRLILSEFSLGITVEELQKLYLDLTKKSMNFMMIDVNKRNIRSNIEDIVLEY